MAGLQGLGAVGSGGILQNLRGAGRPNGPDGMVPEGGASGRLQANHSTTTTHLASMSGMSTQFGQLLNGNAGPQQSQVVQALVALMVLIALLEQLQQGQQGQQTGAKLLDALSSGRGTGRAQGGSYLASSYVAYQQTTVTVTLSSGDTGAVGGQTGNQGQMDVTA